MSDMGLKLVADAILKLADAIKTKFPDAVNQQIIVDVSKADEIIEILKKQNQSGRCPRCYATSITIKADDTNVCGYCGHTWRLNEDAS